MTVSPLQSDQCKSLSLLSLLSEMRTSLLLTCVVRMAPSLSVTIATCTIGPTAPARECPSPTSPSPSPRGCRQA